MKKFFVNILCGFIPSKSKRHAVRKILLNKSLETSTPNDCMHYADDTVIIKQGIYCNPTNIHLLNNVLLQRFVDIYEGTTIGRYTYLGDYTKVDRFVSIGKYCSIADHVLIGATKHPIDWLSSSPFQYDEWLDEKCKKLSWEIGKNTIIGNDVWIGSGAVIQTGVKIGDGAIIGSRAVVTKDVPPYAIVAGVPAKIIRYRFNEDIIKQLLNVCWWNLSHEEIRQLPFNNISKCLEKLK